MSLIFIVHSIHTYGGCCHTPGISQTPLKPLRRGGKALHEEVVKHRLEVLADISIHCRLGTTSSTFLQMKRERGGTSITRVMVQI